MVRYGWLITVVGLVVVLVLLIVSRGNLSSVEADLDAAEQQNTSLSSQLQQAQTDKSQLQADLDTANADLAAIQLVYPPQNFSSPLALESWLGDNEVSEQPFTPDLFEWASKALQLQADALADGFIVNVDLDYDPINDINYIFCTTVIDGFIWFWDPETDDVLNSGFGPVG